MIVLGGRVDGLEESGYEMGAVIDNKRITEWGQGMLGPLA